MFSNIGVSFWALLLNCFPVEKRECLNESEMLREIKKRNDHSFNKAQPGPVLMKPPCPISQKVHLDFSVMLSMMAL